MNGNGLYFYKTHLATVCKVLIHNSIVLYSGATLNNEITNKNHKNEENIAINNCKKDLILQFELKPEDRALLYSNLNGNILLCDLNFHNYAKVPVSE